MNDPYEKAVEAKNRLDRPKVRACVSEMAGAVENCEKVVVPEKKHENPRDFRCRAGRVVGNMG
jgi:hypothetical protein